MKLAVLFNLAVCLTTSAVTLNAQQTDGGEAPDSGRVFMAGASIVDITPPLGEEIVGNWDSPPATHVHDPLHTRSLVLDDGDSRLVFVLIDNVSVDREVLDTARKLIGENTGLPGKYLMMAATHTHSGTSASGKGARRRGWNAGEPLDDYQQFLVGRITDGVRIAINNLEPARIGWGAGNVPQHVFNRRWIMKDPVINPFGGVDKAKMNPGVGNPDLVKPAGPTDPQVSFISVQSAEGRPIALLGNYSLHYVGGVPKGHLSADYFAVFANRIAELLKAEAQDPPFVGILSNGTSGDVNNINFGEPAGQHPPYAKMRMVANDVAGEVFRVYKTIKHHSWLPLGAAQSELMLMVRQPDAGRLAQARKALAKPGTEELLHPLEKVYAERVLQIHEEWPDSVSVPLQTFRIGELGIAAVPFETFTETGLEIKEKSPFSPSFTIELANGSYGYLPTPAQHELGGYETWLGTNRVETEASEKIVAELISLFSTLR